MKIVLFDFCDTLVNFQTADAYTDYVVEFFATDYVRAREKIYFCLKEKRSIANYLNKHGAINKRLKLWRLKGLSRKVLEEAAEKFYKEKIVVGLQIPLIRLLKKYQSEGYKVYLVSGGYDIYLKLFVEEYKLDGLLSTKLRFKKGTVFSGYIWKKDCMNREKVKMLNQYFADKIIDFSISYSDSISDLPLLKWTDTGVVVSKFQYREWPEVNGLEQIVLSRMKN